MILASWTPKEGTRWQSCLSIGLEDEHEAVPAIGHGRQYDRGEQDAFSSPAAITETSSSISSGGADLKIEPESLLHWTIDMMLHWGKTIR